MHQSTTDNVSRFILDNGLRVLIKENHATPVAAVLAHVDVGYFNEPDRWNGIAHVVEHMFFKGTSNRPAKEQIAEEIRALGGSINAGTYYDQTTYYVVVPSAGVERAIEIQADTFLNSLFNAEELAKELEVIIQESKQKRDNPSAMLVESMYALSYDEHRVRRWRIGPDEILRSLRRDDLTAFVGQTYRPENIVLTIAGDVDTVTVMEWVTRWWGGMPSGNFVKERSPVEPERAQFRFNRMRGDIQQRLVEMGFHAPPILHEDAAPLMVLGSLLSDGRSARLYRTLREDRRLVSAAWAGYEGFDDIGIFTLGAECLQDDPMEAERGLLEVVGRLAAEGPTRAELERVKTRIESRRLFGQEEVLGMARLLASYEALGDYRYADEMLARIRRVGPGDVARVASQYVRLDRATIQEYLPAGADVPARSAEETRQLLQGDTREPVTPPEVMVPTAERVVETSLDSGATVLFRRRTDLPIVALHLLFPGGKLGENKSNAGITNLMLKSMQKGAGGLSAEEIALRIEELGTSIGTSMAADYFGFSLKILADRLPEGIAVLRDVINAPLFLDVEVEKERQAILAEIRRQQDSMSARAVDLLNAAMWGELPYGLPFSGVPEAVAGITQTDLCDWHRRWVDGRQAVIGVVGSLAESQLRDVLSGLAPERGESVQGSPVNFTTEFPSDRSVRVEKQQTAAVIAFPGAAVHEDARHGLDLIAEITSGLAGRFFQAVRGDNALAYAVSSFHRARRFGGSFGIYTATSPEREETARAILLQECGRLREELAPVAELDSARTAIRGERVTSLQTFGSQAAELAVNRLYGLPIDAGDRYLTRLEGITPEELRETAASYLREDRMWLGVVRGAGTTESG